MVYCFLGTKPFLEVIMMYCQLNASEQILLRSKCNNLYYKIALKYCTCKMSAKASVLQWESMNAGISRASCNNNSLNGFKGKAKIHCVYGFIQFSVLWSFNIKMPAYQYKYSITSLQNRNLVFVSRGIQSSNLANVDRPMEILLDLDVLFIMMI